MKIPNLKQKHSSILELRGKWFEMHSIRSTINALIELYNLVLVCGLSKRLTRSISDFSAIFWLRNFATGAFFSLVFFLLQAMIYRKHVCSMWFTEPSSITKELKGRRSCTYKLMIFISRKMNHLSFDHFAERFCLCL